jgi:hypothetical protein
MDKVIQGDDEFSEMWNNIFSEAMQKLEKMSDEELERLFGENE